LWKGGERDLEASATGAIPEKARLRSTASKETPPTKMGIILMKPSFSDTHSPIQSLCGFTPLYVPFTGINYRTMLDSKISEFRKEQANNHVSASREDI
jgi:hypothetical protein